MVAKVVMAPPDGGWGWAVVFGCAWTNAFIQSLLSLFGLIFGDKLIEMGEATVGAATVANVMLLMVTFSGIITGPALKKFSPRQVGIVGSMMASLGLILASYATMMWHLIVTYSIFTGLGLGFIQASSFLSVNQYFRLHRGKAIGIAYAGTGIGQMLMPYLVQYLLNTTDYRTTAIVLGILALNGIIGASLFRPVDQYMRIAVQEPNEKDPLIEKAENNNIQESLRRKSLISYDNVDSEIIQVDDKSLEKSKSVTSEDYDYEKGMEASTENTQSSSSILSKINKIFDLDLLKDLSFVSIIMASTLGFTSNQSFNVLFPFFLQQHLKLSREQAAMCMSVLAATDIVSRLTFPIVTDKYRISSKFSFYVGCITLALTRTALSFQETFIGVFIFSAISGVFRSLIVIHQNQVIAEYCEGMEHKLSAAFALNMVMKGVSVMTLGQLIGWVRDLTGSYVICILAQNSLYGLVVLVWTPQFIYQKCRRRK